MTLFLDWLINKLITLNNYIKLNKRTNRGKEAINDLIKMVNDKSDVSEKIKRDKS